MADLQSYIGATLSIAIGAKPATRDKVGYEALDFVEIGKIMSIPAIGDTHASIDVDLLSEGRVAHVIGSADGGANEVTLAADGDDLGQIDLEDVNGLNTENSFRIVDPAPSNEHVYFGGLVSGFKDTERTTGAYKGKTFTMLVNTPTLRTTPPTP